MSSASIVGITTTGVAAFVGVALASFTAGTGATSFVGVASFTVPAVKEATPTKDVASVPAVKEATPTKAATPVVIPTIEAEDIQVPTPQKEAAVAAIHQTTPTTTENVLNKTVELGAAR